LLAHSELSVGSDQQVQISQEGHWCQINLGDAFRRSQTTCLPNCRILVEFEITPFPNELWGDASVS